MNSWLEEAFNIDPGFARGLQFVIALLIVLGLIAVFVWILRRISGVRVGRSPRNRQPRIAVMDSTALDARRRLILVRRDNIEHLLLVGGPSDVVVEQNIMRGQPAAGYARQPVQQPQQSMAQAAMQGGGAMAPARPMAPAPRGPQSGAPTPQQPPAAPAAPRGVANVAPPRPGNGDVAQPATTAQTRPVSSNAPSGTTAFTGMAGAAMAGAGAAAAVAGAKDAVGQIGAAANSTAAARPVQPAPTAPIEPAAPSNGPKAAVATPVSVTSGTQQAAARAPVASPFSAFKPAIPSAESATPTPVSKPAPVSDPTAPTSTQSPAPAQAGSEPLVQAPKPNQPATSGQPAAAIAPEVGKPQPAGPATPAVAAPGSGPRVETQASDATNGDKPTATQSSIANAPALVQNESKADKSPEISGSAAMDVSRADARPQPSLPGVDLAAHLEEALLGPATPPDAQVKPSETPVTAKTSTPVEPPAKPAVEAPKDAVMKTDQAEREEHKGPDAQKDNGGPATSDNAVTIDTIEEEMAKLLNEIGGKDRK